MLTQKDGYCSLCWSQCGVRYGVEDDRIVSVMPLAEHPNGGATCAKGRAAGEILDNPERLLHPMRRTRPKTEADPGWERISWEAALDEIASRLSQIRAESGAEAVAFSTATNGATGLNDSIEWIDHLIRHFGSPNKINAVELCDYPKTFVHPLTFGASIPFPEFESADTILLWGFNPSSTWLNVSSQIAEARERGAKIIVVDPRRAGFGLDADRWLRIRPGSDGVLALGLAHLLIEAGAIDTAFLQRWSNGPLLVRADTGRFLRGADLATAIADPAAYLAWEEGTGRLVAYDARTRCFAADADSLALEGEIAVATTAGTLSCRPAFALYAERCAEYPPERVATLTWLDEADIRAAAAMIAAARRLAYYTWTGTSQHAQAGQTDRAIALAMALLGQFDAPGGNVVPTPVPRAPIGAFDILPQTQRDKTIGLDRLPLGPPAHGIVTGNHFRCAVLEGVPYRIRALVGFGANMVLAHADAPAMRKALEALEFYVHCDIFENPTARFADILLPINTHLEREALRIGFQGQANAEEHVQLRQRMVQPRGEARSDVEVCFDLGVRLGHGEAFFGGDIEAGFRAFLAPTGVSLEALRENPRGIRVAQPRGYRRYAQLQDGGVQGFDTETGLVEIYSEPMLRHGQAPLPQIDSTVLPGGGEFPLALTSSKSGYFCHSQHRSIPSLRRREMDPAVELAPPTAAGLGLEDGDWAFVETTQGRVRMRVRTNADLHPRVANGSYGWWQGNSILGLAPLDPFSDSGSNYNLLVDSRRADPITGVPAHRSTSCRVVPVEPKAGWAGFRPFRIEEAERVSDDILMLVMRPQTPTELPDYQPGQHVNLRWRLANGTSEVRSYSLIGPAIEAGRNAYRIAIRRSTAPEGSIGIDDGLVSTDIHARVRAGDVLELRAPTGDFMLPLESERPIVMVAGGVGITPFLAYLETVAGRAGSPRIHLVYANRTRGGQAFRTRIRDLAGAIPTLSVTELFSRDGTAGPHRRRPTVDDVLLPSFRTQPLVFMCGPSAMMNDLRAALVARGLDNASILQEAFEAELDRAVVIPEGPLTVTYARSGVTATWRRADGSLLNLAESCGLALASGCRVGQCESCAAPVISGSVVHRVRLNSPDETSCLLCQAVPTSDLVLDA